MDADSFVDHLKDQIDDPRYPPTESDSELEEILVLDNGLVRVTFEDSVDVTRDFTVQIEETGWVLGAVVQNSSRFFFGKYRGDQK